MPRFYFHVEEARVIPDEDGAELADVHAARLEAVRVAGAMLRDHAEAFWTEGEWRVVVTDEERTVLFTIVCQALASPEPPRSYRPPGPWKVVTS